MHPQFLESSITFVMAAMMAAHTMARADRSHSTRAVVGLMVALMVWTGLVALSRVEPDPARSYALSCAALAGAFFVPPAWVWLALSFTSRVRLIGLGRVALAVFAPSFAVSLALITNPLHGALIAHPELLTNRGAPEWAGSLFWPWIIWAYLLVVAGSALYVRASVRMLRGRVQMRSVLMVVAALLPLSSSASQTFGLVEATYDRTPLLLGISTILLYVADWRYRLLDTMPITRRDIIDQLQDGVVVADPDGMIVHMNTAAEHMTEVRLAEVAGQPLARVVAAQSEGRMEYDHAAFTRVLREMCTSQSGFETQLENYLGRVYEIRGSSVTDAEGDVAGIYLILRDRTAASRYESVLRQSRRSEAVTGLAAGIAHEVNNPLAYVRANVTHLLGLLPKSPEREEALAGEVAEDMREVLEESLEGIDRIGTIVERLQRLSSPEPVHPTEFDVNELIHEAVRARGLDASEDIVVHLQLSEQRCPVRGHREGLLYAVIEVLENAERAIGDRPGHIDLRSARRDGDVVVVIDDDGPGVSAELRERVFDPFYTTRTDEPGSGLGLAVASRSVGDLGGSIGLGESPRGGAQVVIRLPAEGA